VIQSADASTQAWKQAALVRQVRIEGHIKTVRALLSVTMDCELTPVLLGLIARADIVMQILEAEVALGLDLLEVPTEDTQPA
jgi:hypothetical protein